MPAMAEGLRLLRALRIVLFLAALAGLAIVWAPVALLYRDGVKYYVHHSFEDSRQITQVLTLALYVLPVLVAVAALLALSWISRRAVVYLRVLTGLALLAGLQGCAFWATLPYGFGSGYEHASPEQWQHLRMTWNTGIGGFLLAVALWLVEGFVSDRSDLAAKQDGADGAGNDAG